MVSTNYATNVEVRGCALAQSQRSGANLTVRLCLRCAIYIRSNNIMPPLVTGRTQIRLRPAICFIIKQCPRRPMMVLGAVGTAYLAFMARVSWLNVRIRNTSGGHNFLVNEMRCSFSAMSADEKKGFVSALINTPFDIPLLFQAAFFACVARPFKGFFCHGILPILR